MSQNVSRTQEERRVLAGTLVGTTIEWYDFFIFAQLTATLLTPLFLAPLGESNPGSGTDSLLRHDRHFLLLPPAGRHRRRTPR